MSKRFIYYDGDIVVDVDAQAFITAANIIDVTQRSAINTLVTYYKSNSVWTKLLAFYPMVGGTAFAHKFNLVNPLDTNGAFRITFNGTWNHSSTGAKPNGVNAYGDTHFDPSVNYTSINNSGIGYYSRTDDSTLGPRRPFGASNGVNTYITWSVDTISTVYQGGLIGASYTQTDTLKHHIVNRFTSSNLKFYKDGIQVGTNTSTIAIGAPASNIYLGCDSQGNSPNFYSPLECAGAHIHQGLVIGDIAILTTGINNFNATLGRQV